jgi:hypothetical protein
MGTVTVLSAATIIVLGDPGPFRTELLTHPDLEVLWATSPGEASMLLGSSRAKACLISPEFERSPVLRLVLRAAGTRVPVIMLRTAGAASLALDTSKVRVLEVFEVGALMSVLSEELGVLFKRHPRAQLAIPVVLEQDGRRVDGRTVELGVTGATLRDLPHLPLDLPVRLAMRLETTSLILSARILCMFDSSGVRCAALEFVDLKDEEREVLRQTVERRLLWEHDQQLQSADLLGPREAPEEPVPEPSTTDDLEGVHPLLGGEFLGQELRALALLFAGELPVDELPVWLVMLAGELTPLEIEAACGGAAPAWARHSLELRTALTRARFGGDEAEHLDALVEDGFRLVRTLRDAPLCDDAEVLWQVARIRASLLREIVSRLVRRRRASRDVRQLRRRLPMAG